MPDEKITVENVNTPERTQTVRADKYRDMRRALLQVVPTSSPGLSFNDIKERAKPHLCPDLFPNGATSGWWAKCVQLDLEAKGRLARTKGAPLRFYQT